MKNQVFWYKMPCRLVNSYWSFDEIAACNFQGLICPWRNKFLQAVLRIV